MPSSDKFRRPIRFSSLIYKISCLLATLVNVTYITQVYFRYHVTIKVAAYVQSNLELPKLTLCFDIDSVLHGKRQMEYFKTQINYTAVTVGEIKSKMPGVDDVIDHCLNRDWDSDSVLLLELEDCMRYFSIEMFPFQVSMCYKVTPRPTNYKLVTVTHSLELRRFLYGVIIKSPLNQGHKLLPILHFSERPFHDRFFANEVLASGTSGVKYVISYNFYDLNSLPAPYESKCSIVSPAECFVRCVDQRYSTLNVSFDRFLIFNTNDSKLMPFYFQPEGRNRTKVGDSTYTEHFEICYKRCPVVPVCHLTFTETQVATYPSTFNLILMVYTLARPAILQKTVASMDFLEFFTQLTSVCSFWLGFSVIGLSEMHLRRAHSIRICADQLFCLRRRAEHFFRFFHVQRRPAVAVRVKKANLVAGKNSFSLVSKSISMLVKIIAIIAFSLTIFQTFVKYFSYEVTTQITYELDPLISTTDIHLCFSLKKMIGAAEKGVITLTNYDKLLTDRGSYSNKSLAQLMSMAVDSRKIIAGCRLWDQTGSPWILTKRQERECLQFFRVSSYFMAGDVCYIIGPKDNQTQWQSHKTRLLDTAILYSIILPRWAKKRSLRIILQNSGEMPRLSKRFSARIYSFGGKRLYRLSSRYRVERLMPPPYRTRCSDSRSRFKCLQHCLVNKTLEQTGFFPLSEIIDQQAMNRYNSARVISYTLLKNESLLEQWLAIEDNCSRDCDQPGCKTSSIVTSVSTELRSSVDYELMLDVRSEPDEETKTLAKTSLYWLYYQVFGCANFWLAFIIIYANPFRHCLKDKEVIEKLNRNILSFKHQVAEAVEMLNVRLRLQFTLKAPKRPCLRAAPVMTFRVLCALGTLLHLYMCIAEYMKYPTELYTRSLLSKINTNYSLSICSPFLEISAWSDYNEYYDYLITRDELDVRSDRAFNRSIDELIASRPAAGSDLLECTFRGFPDRINGSGERTALTDRIFFREARNMSICKNLYPRRSIIMGGLYCDQYNSTLFVKRSNQLFNKPESVMGLSVDANSIVYSFSAIVSPTGGFPILSGIWAERVLKPGAQNWFELSISEYIEESLQPHYDHDGLSSLSRYQCHSKCLSEKLFLHNLASYTARPTKWHLKFPLKSHLRDPKISKVIKITDKTCLERCLTTGEISLERRYMVTHVGPPLAGRAMKNGSIEFVVSDYRSPTMVVIFKPKWYIIELIIAIGSILNIWWGLSALGLDPSRKNADPLASQELDQCRQYVNHIQSLFIAYSRQVSRPLIGRIRVNT